MLPDLPPAAPVDLSDLPPLPEWVQAAADERRVPAWAEAGLRVIEVDGAGQARAALDRLGQAAGAPGSAACAPTTTVHLRVLEDAPAPDRLRAYVGGWGACGAAGLGRLRWVDGREWVGEVAPGGPGLLPRPAGLGLWTLPGGTRHLVRQGPAGTERLMAFHASGRWWAQGRFDAGWNSPAGAWRGPDGARFDGPLRAGVPEGAGQWRDAHRLVRIEGRFSVPADRLQMQGPLVVTLSAPVDLDGEAPLRRPPGRYLASAAAPHAPRDWPRLVLRPDEATLAANPAAPACGLTLAAPPGWRVDGPTCRGPAGQGTQAVSPDARFTVATPDGEAWRELTEFDAADLPRWELRWRGGRVTLDARGQPQVEGVAELQGAAAGFLFRGRFEGRLPQGVGHCPRPAAEGGGEELCEYDGGRRIDLVHLERERAAGARRR